MWVDGRTVAQRTHLALRVDGPVGIRAQAVERGRGHDIKLALQALGVYDIPHL
jgi:hypothetical protein